jgi:hypothetical protein
MPVDHTAAEPAVREGDLPWCPSPERATANLAAFTRWAQARTSRIFAGTQTD